MEEVGVGEGGCVGVCVQVYVHKLGCVRGYIYISMCVYVYMYTASIARVMIRHVMCIRRGRLVSCTYTYTHTYIYVCV